MFVPVFLCYIKRPMQIIKKTIAGLSLCFIGLGISQTSEGANQLTISPVVYHFKYQEFNDSDVLLDQEKGFMPGIRLSLLHPDQSGNIETHVAYYAGRVEYAGQTQSGTPHNTHTDETLLNLGIRVHPHNATVFAGQLFYGYQYWHWDRDILPANAVRGLHEIYTWQEIEAGLRYQRNLNDTSLLWAELSGIYILDPNMTIKLPHSQAKLNSGSRPGFRIRAGKTWQLRNRDSVSINLLAEYWSFGKSNTVFSNDFFGTSAYLTEPMSRSFHTGLEFSYSLSF